jgi:hypothetical protein
MLDRCVDAVLDVLLVAAAVLGAVALAPSPGARFAPLASGPDRVALDAAIGRLIVAEAHAATAYDRAQFPHWSEITPGCDTRCVVLDRQRSAGGWLSAYDGYVAGHAGDLEVDHVVPLAEAWVSGASTWTLARRQAFANDLEGAELLAVSAWSNRDKGADDPAGWRPPDPGWWCAYTDAWVAVKLRWQLTADAAEVAALHDMARRC